MRCFPVGLLANTCPCPSTYSQAIIPAKTSSECVAACEFHSGFKCTGFGFDTTGCHLYEDSSDCGDVPKLDWYTCSTTHLLAFKTKYACTAQELDNNPNLHNGGVGYQGCFKNEGDDRMGGHEAPESIATFEVCQQRAMIASKPFFGLEYPQVDGGVPHDAQCMMLDTLPGMDKMDDKDCEFDKDYGRRLGGANRLAVYKTISKDSQCACSGATNKAKKFGRDCKDVYLGKPACYVDPEKCAG